MSGFSTQDIINLSNESHAEGLAEGAALRDELAEALSLALNTLTSDDLDSAPMQAEMARLAQAWIRGKCEDSIRAALAKYEASKS